MSLVPVLFTFYIQGVLKLKKIIPAPKGAGWPAPRPGRFTAGTESRRLCWPRGRSGCVREISPPPGFESRTMQPVVSLDIDYAIPAALRYLYTENYRFCTLYISSSSLPGGGTLVEEVLMYKDRNLHQPTIQQPTSLCKATNWMFALISL